MKEQDIKAALADFRTFLSLAWEHLGHSKPSPVQLDIANFLQHGGDHVMVQAFRGVGKSYITAAYVVWRLLLNPDLKIKAISATTGYASNLAHFCNKLLDMDVMECRRPGPKQRSSSVSFDVKGAKTAKDPSLMSVGIFGQVTGHRADIVLADDIEVQNNSETQTQREKIRHARSEFSNILKPGGKIIYLGTPQTEESIYKDLPSRGYTVRIWPFEVPKDMSPYVGHLTPYMERLCDEKDPGYIVEPRFTEDDRMLRIAEGKAMYQLQYMLNTELSDLERYPLRFNDLMVMDVDPSTAPEKLVWANDPDLRHTNLPNVGFDGEYFHRPWQTIGEWTPYQGCAMSIDVAGRGGNDETAYAIVKQLNGYLYVVDVGGLTTGYSEHTWKTLATKAKDHGVNQIIFETNYGDGVHLELFKPILNRIHPCSIEEVKHTTNKENRIVDTIEPLMATHKLVIDRTLIANDYTHTKALYREKNATQYMLMYQMSRIARLKGALSHDDRLDALAMALAYWRRTIGVDVDKQMQRKQDTAMEDFFRKAKMPGRINHRSPPTFF